MSSPNNWVRLLVGFRSSMRRATNWVYRNLFFLIAAVIGPTVIFFVPQVFNVWYSERPPVNEFATGWFWLWWGFAVFLVFVLMFFCAAVYLVPRPYTRRPKPLITRHVSMRNARNVFVNMFQVACVVVDYLVTLPAVAIEHVRGRGTRLVLGAVVAVAAIAILLFGPAVDYGWPYSLAGAFYRNLAWWLLAVGAWIIGCGLLLAREEKLRDNADRPVLVLVGRFLAFAALTYLAAEALWAGANLPPVSHVFTFRAYTLWMILHVWGVSTVIAASLDYADTHMRLLPVRVLGFVAIVVIFLVSRPAANSDVFHVAATAEMPAPLDGLSQLETRIRGIPENEPVVFVAASGGGSRAAIFTSLVYEFLARRPVQASGRSAQATPRNWADNIVMVSSVSGGSLATAHFVERDTKASDLRERTENAILDELVSRFESNVKMLAEQEPTSAADKATFEKARDRALAVVESVKASRAGNGQEDWLIRSSFIDDMGLNFMAPIVRGATTMNLPRGQALGQFWDDRFGWATSDNVHGFAMKDVDALAPLAISDRPLVVFNACDVSKGSRIAIGFPPLPADMFAEAAKETTRAAPFELAHAYRDETIGVTLSKAVRLSSNFPWAFHPTVVEPLDPTSGETKTLILDGGIADNTGIDTVFELMRGLAATKHPAGKNILRLLRRRQIVFLEIDSGSKPSPPTSLSQVFAVVLEPIQALDNAAYTNADHAKQQYVHSVGEHLSLARDFESDSLTPEQREALRAVPANITPITVRCNHFSLEHPDRNSVMTAWALGPNDKANVLARFAFELGRLEDALASVERVGPDFTTAKRSLYRLFPEQAGNQLLAEIEASQQFANALTDKLAKADSAKFPAEQQKQIAEAIRPYRRTAERVAAIADRAQTSGRFGSSISPDELKLWSHAWQHKVAANLPEAAGTGMLSSAETRMSSEWAQAFAGPNEVESPAETAQAIEQLRVASRKLESSRRTVERSNEGSKAWFDDAKGHRSRSRHGGDEKARPSGKERTQTP
jgi:hypothetical protein